jgi:hypothetical protein
MNDPLPALRTYAEFAEHFNRWADERDRQAKSFKPVENPPVFSLKIGIWNIRRALRESIPLYMCLRNYSLVVVV